jgi:hypothetical protein
MKKMLPMLSCVLAMYFLSSCATIFSGTRQTVRIESYPPGASVEIDGISHGTTPADVPMKKNLNQTSVVLNKDGYQTKTFSPTATFDVVSIINIFFWPGFIVDAVTGAIKKYDPLLYKINLEPSTKVSATN